MSDHHLPVPIEAEVDCCVLGGSSAAVAAAAAARAGGARVLLLAERPYLGEDIAGALRLWTDGEEPEGALATALFADGVPTPMQVKYQLEQHLLEHAVDFLYGCFAAGVLTDADGGCAGVLVGSRARLFAVRARTVIDATQRAVAARALGLTFAPWPSGELTVERVVVGGEGNEALAPRADELPLPKGRDGKEGSIPERAWRYRFPLRVADGGCRALAAAEQDAIDATWHHGQTRASDLLWFVPPDPLADGREPLADWHTDAALDAFRCDDGRLWIASGCAALEPGAAERLLAPTRFAAFGARLGAAVATELGAGSPPAVAGLRFAGDGSAAPEGARLSLADDPLDRAAERPRLLLDLAEVPRLHEVDVLVIGGGTGGAPAGIAAARQGARTLVCEYLPGLGGVGTMGMIGNYHHGNRRDRRGRGRDGPQRSFPRQGTGMERGMEDGVVPPAAARGRRRALVRCHLDRRAGARR